MDLSLIVAAAAAVVSLFALGLSYLSYRDSHQHKRLHDTIEVIKEWDTPPMLKARAQMMQVNDSQLLLIPDAIPFEDIMAQRKTESDEGEEITISDHLNTLLNYMNVVALGVKVGVYDRDMITHAMQQPFARIFYALEVYRKNFVSKRVRHKDPWKELTALVDAWQKESNEDLVPKSIPGA